MTVNPRLSLLAGVALTLSVALTGCSASGTAPDPSSTPDGATTENVTAPAVNVGDCRVEAATGLPEDAEVVPCAEQHDEEVFHEFTAPGDTFSVEAVDAATADCVGDAFTEFIGVAREESALNVYPILPTAETWDQPDGRKIFCVLVDPAGPIEGTLEGTAR